LQELCDETGSLGEPALGFPCAGLVTAVPLDSVLLNASMFALADNRVNLVAFEAIASDETRHVVKSLGIRIFVVLAQIRDVEFVM
jgi:hypothetical protein